MKSDPINCELVQNCMQDYLDGDCGSSVQAKIESHLQGCAECHDLLLQEQALRNLLRGLPVPPPSEGYIDRAFRTLEAQHSAGSQSAMDSKRHGFIWGFGSAIAAGLALWILVAVMPVADLPNAPAGELRIALHETHKLRLAFTAGSDVKNATISISLPGNVTLDGYPGESNLEWQTDLAKGDNTLTLPIRAELLDKGVLVAQIKHNGNVKTIKVNLQVTKPGVSSLELTPRVNA